MNFRESEKTIAAIQRWYVDEIHRAAAEVGGLEKLSASIGYDPKYLYRVLQRNSFSPLRRAVTKIHETKK